jgi:hypothetical protein
MMLIKIVIYAARDFGIVICEIYIICKRERELNMNAQAYEGYFENGGFYTAGRVINIPERRRVYITVLDEAIAENENAEAWQEFIAEIRKIDSEPLPEFERIKFREEEI